MRFLGVILIILLILFSFHHQGLAEDNKYIVKPGDSLYTISRSLGVSLIALKEANRLEGNMIRPKQVLVIPVSKDAQGERQIKKIEILKEHYIVKKGDNLYSISKRVGVSVDEIKRINHLRSSSLKIGQRLLLNKPSIHIEDELEDIPSDAEMSSEVLSIEGDVEIESKPIGKWKSEEERNLFIRVVKTFLGVPYKLGGSTLKGIDCSAFVKKIYEIFNIDLPRTVREQFKFGKKVEKDQLEKGDLVFFRSNRANNAHVGIYIGDNKFVHASYRDREVRIDDLNSPYFKRYFLKGIRVKELERES